MNADRCDYEGDDERNGPGAVYPFRREQMPENLLALEIPVEDDDEPLIIVNIDEPGTGARDAIRQLRPLILIPALVGAALSAAVRTTRDHVVVQTVAVATGTAALLAGVVFTVTSTDDPRPGPGSAAAVVAMRRADSHATTAPFPSSVPPTSRPCLRSTVARTTKVTGRTAPGCEARHASGLGDLGGGLKRALSGLAATELTDVHPRAASLTSQVPAIPERALRSQALPLPLPLPSNSLTVPPSGLSALPPAETAPFSLIDCDAERMCERSGRD
jgi:hypothetical protein